MTARLKERYFSDIRPKLVADLGLPNIHAAPGLEKIVLNMGLGDAKQDAKILESATEQLAAISGQRPSVRRARKSVAGFKVREGMPVGIAVTLRGERMYEMLDRLLSIALPRVRDFRGLSPKAFDGHGNYSFGIREQIIFPEIDYDSIDQIRGLDVTLVTTADNDADAYFLLADLGLPLSGAPRGVSGDAQGATDGDKRGKSEIE